ncbi:MAG: T9SS type A sorting domain-containing protein, partial [Bacteroidetes bacterium]|nr:T9SS type A sorting domain-containing protein [Bacteroidota bacterium]
ERAAASAKDNRLLPLGFSVDSPLYDTTRVEGAALMDQHFTSQAGAGMDELIYEINPVDVDITGGDCCNVTVDVRMWYQSMPARWLNPMFALQDSSIQAFEAMFLAQGAAPELVAFEQVVIPVTGGIGDASRRYLSVHPNPTRDGRVFVTMPPGDTGTLWELYNPAGSRIQHGVTSPTFELQLPATAGTYVLRVHGGAQTWTRRIVRN